MPDSRHLAVALSNLRVLIQIDELRASARAA
jgi:hypothetical protein